ncbi:ACT domain-containing protein [Methylophaga sp.]|jgi:glycine cleavage system transcriptional repressor|uniref:glycine cleavage system protein R n=1 Tax=Methylophaga sp. TaxID=2024840 RepID=UPI001400D17F|nr:ACT domain-containing protein [Methylophaga sp.]MTI64495.1 ACT domain-containing protein [Methylophaga sp.]
MNKVLISVLGSDQPGIMAKVATVIKQHNGNIENLSQTLLDNAFGALLLVSLAEDDSAEKLQQSLQEQSQGMNLYIRVHPWQAEASDWYSNKRETQPYIVTAIGPDRQGLVAEIAGELFKHGVNITNIQAIFKGGKNPMDNLMVFEVDVPRATVMNDLRDALDAIAARLNLEISVQHRKIFESVSNILN